VRELGIAGDKLQAVAAAEQQELERRERTYRDQRPPPELTGKVLIVVDDGLATGATMWAAVAAIRRQQPARAHRLLSMPGGMLRLMRNRLSGS
jgi:putative phosphoribosyl transferase